MKFDSLNTVIRPRESWEATDLGISMVRRQWLLIYVSMLMFIIPVGVLAYYLFPINLMYAVLLVWWFKPVYDRTTLYIISQSLFGSPPTVRQTLIHSAIALFQIFPELLTRLFTFRRSFRMPVTDLEGLKGSARSARLKMLVAGAKGNGLGITIVLPLLEMMIAISLMVLIIFFHPGLEGLNESDSASSMFIFYYEKDWLIIVFYAVYILSVVIIEPIYVACGFAQYINRRTYLEAWDIEIAFNRLAQRQRQLKSGKGKGFLSVALSTCMVSLMMIGSDPGYANTDTQQHHKLTLSESKIKINKVMERREFLTTIEVKYWEEDSQRPLKNVLPAIDSNSYFNFNLSAMIEILLWMCLAGGVVAGAFFSRKYIYLRKYFDESKSPPEKSEVHFDLDLRPESLPTDIVSEARKLWGSTSKVAAISVLYRAALVNFMSNDNLELLASATERECLKIIEQHSSSQRSQCFKAIVLSWQNVAYAHQVPDDKSFNDLCLSWPVLEVNN